MVDAILTGFYNPTVPYFWSITISALNVYWGRMPGIMVVIFFFRSRVLFPFLCFQQTFLNHTVPYFYAECKRFNSLYIEATDTVSASFRPSDD